MKGRNLLILMALMVIGEVIFVLPFVITRIFRPTFLTVFNLTNLELGTAFSGYGIVAMIAYFAGGPLADRLNPKRLIPIALGMTAIGGVWLYSIPGVGSLMVLYAFWGGSTILLFWSSFVKAQRQLGLHTGAGKSFGLVDAGRGAIAALMGSTAVYLLDALLPVEAASASLAQLTSAMQGIILIFSALTLACALLAYGVLGNDKVSVDQLSLKGVIKAIQNRAIWQHAIMVMCAYVGYKCTDDFSLLAKDVLGYDDVESARLASWTFWARPVAAVACGIFADKWLTSKVIGICFGITMVGSLCIALGSFSEWMLILVLTNTSAAIYGLRGIYYALFEEAKLSMEITGSAAGLVSVVGYTPDIFMGPLMGVILDSFPGALGHRYLFLTLAGFSIIGLVSSVVFRKQR